MVKPMVGVQEKPKHCSSADEEDIFSVTVINYKIIAWALILANLIVIAIIVCTDRTTSDFIAHVPIYAFLIIINLVALTCAVFALKTWDYRLLYPILFTSAFLVVISVSFSALILSSRIHCALAKTNKTHLLFISSVLLLTFHNLSIGKNCNEKLTASIEASAILMIVAFEKLFEMFIYHRLLKLFKHYHDNLDSRNIKVKNTLSLDDDTDDEITVYKKVVDDGGLQKVNDYGAAKPN